MTVDQHVDLRAHSVSDRADAGKTGVDEAASGAILLGLPAEAVERGHLDRIESGIGGGPGGGRERLGRPAPEDRPVDVRVQADAAVGRATQQLGDGRTEALPEQVPERLLDRTDRRVVSHPAEGGRVWAERWGGRYGRRADERPRGGRDLGEDLRLVTVERRLTHPGPVVVGLDDDEDPVRSRGDVDGSCPDRPDERRSGHQRPAPSHGSSRSGSNGHSGRSILWNGSRVRSLSAGPGVST